MALAVGLEEERGQGSRSALEPLNALVRDDLQRVNQTVLAYMDSPVALIPQLAGHIIAAGGKRLRPMLTLASARLCGYQGDRHLGLAAAVEFIHTATLLHDDVVDDSNLRRGRATANSVWGNQASVLVGDFLFSRAFQLMVADGSLRVLEVLSNASAVIAEGEVQQLMTNNNIGTTEVDYLSVVSAKTAVLFAAACQVGAVVAGRPREEEQALETYGRNFGIAFQLVDDILDYSAEEVNLGKSVGDDFREGKMTLPVVLAYERASEAERDFLRRCMEELEQSEEDLKRAIAIMDRCDALADAKTRARAYGDAARLALDAFAPGEAKESLLKVVEFCLERAH